jgi:LmbE family N-acetylglucosaminyl deacetylase
MKVDDFFDRAEGLPIVELGDLLGDGGLVVVAPHPDDESLGCGILIARSVAEGRRVRIVFLSDGIGSHPESKAYPPRRLREMREREACAAAAALGLEVSDLVFLRLPDRFVPSAGRSARAAVESILGGIRVSAASAIFVTWRGDPHCDHRAAYALAREAQRQSAGLRLFEYSIWGRDLPQDDEPTAFPRGWRLAAGAFRARKRAAIECHLSQVSDLISDDPSGFRLDPKMIARFIERDEIFLEMKA